MKNLINYEPSRNYSEFPSDNLGYYRELIEARNNNIEKTQIEIPDEITALATIYNTDGSIDYEEMEQMMIKQSQAGITTVLIAGTTGESSFLSHSEQIEYIKKASEIAEKHNMQIIAGTGSNSTEEQNNLTRGALESGAIANLLLAPYYIKASDGDTIRHLMEGLDLGPAIIYSISGRTGFPISTEVKEILSKHPNFLGIKECDGQEEIDRLKKLGIRVWSGNDNSTFLDIHRHNSDGFISVVANIDPELMLEVNEGTNMTKIKIDRLLHLSYLTSLPGQYNPKPVHNAIEMIRRSTGEIITPATFRKPGGPFTIEQQEYQAAGLRKLGIDAVPFGNNFNRK